MENKRRFTKNQKIIILSLFLVVLILSIISSIIVSSNNTRTIMIYMAGNNLESNGKIATTEINSIVPSKINLKKTNVLLYTGGTKKWHNFVNNEENAIYKLNDNGFEKIDTIKKTDMGSSSTLTYFLNYSYNNFKTNKYDLILWDHGLGSIGSIVDEYTDDYLDLSELDVAFKNSEFNEKRKLNTILFRTCLNGNLEIASVFKKYAKYMIASEEVTVGGSTTSVLNFINNIDENDNEKEYGIKFIEMYKKQVSDLEKFDTVDTTYSIINLTKFDTFINNMNSFFASINVNKNYSQIAKLRSNMHQYGVDTADVYDYDTVDLYELIDGLDTFSDVDAKRVLSILKNDLIEYNYSTNAHSNGLSIYFPFNGSNGMKKKHLKLYDKVNISKEYNKFINDYYSYQTDTSKLFSFNMQNNKTEINKKTFTLELNDEQLKNYASSRYIIFRKVEDNYFVPLLNSAQTTLENNILSANLENNFIAIVDENDNSKEMFSVREIKNENGKKEYTTTCILNKIEKGEMPILENATVHVTVNNDNVKISKVYINDKNGATGALVDLDEYSSIDFPNFRYKILDESGNYTNNWQSNTIKYLFEVKKGKYHLETSSIDVNSNEYYCVFVITDLQNNSYYSNLVQIK